MVPVSLLRGIEPGARTGTSVGGQPVVVWRGQDGAVRAWADRCPHRGMRLSFGFVRANALTCIYHGWSFGPDKDSTAEDGTAHGTARCLSVPAHPAMAPPAKAAVKPFPVAEALGMVWVGTGPDDTRPPDEGPDHLYPVRSVTVRAPAAALCAALEESLPPGTQAAETSEAGGVVTFKGPAVRVIAAIQDRGDGASAAHVVTTDASPPARRELCLWAALVRDHLAAVLLP